MDNLNVFDVLVVYSDTASSAGGHPSQGALPFPVAFGHANYNDAYAYFLETCQQLGLKAAFSTANDIVAAGTCQSYWIFADKRWQKSKKLCYAPQIFDKTTPNTKEKRLKRKLLFSSTLVKPFNNPHLAALFFDKYKTYQELPDFTIPTVEINDPSRAGIKQAIANLRTATRNHLFRNDFSRGIVLKDRFGSGGNNIFKVTKNYINEIYALIQQYPKLIFVLQPFLKFAKGYTYKNQKAATDIRLIYQNGKIIQTYIRLAKDNDFRCNEHQGGQLLYVSLADIPQKVQLFSQKIALKLQQNHSLFALDYIVSDRGNVYFIEGNSKPGIDWDLALETNEKMSKKLIRGIVTELASRILPLNPLF